MRFFMVLVIRETLTIFCLRYINTRARGFMNLPSKDIAYIPLTQGKTAIVDAKYYKWLMDWKWYAGLNNRRYYAFRRNELTGGILFLHRAIAVRAGKIEHKIIHFNGDTLDNRVDNLVKFGHIKVIPKDLEKRVSPSLPPLAVVLGQMHLSQKTAPDLTNREFGHLWVIGPKEVGRTNPKDLWLCACKCGSSARFVLPGAYLLEHESWSCGCTGHNYPRSTYEPQLIVKGEIVRL